MECLEKSILVWIPFLLLLTSSLYERHNYSNYNFINTSKSSKQWTILFLAKIILTLVLTTFSLVELINIINEYQNDINNIGSILDILTPVVKSLTFIYVIILIRYYRKYGIYSSLVLIIFWSVLAFGSTFNSQIIIFFIYNDVPIDSSLNVFADSTRQFTYPIIIIQLLLSCFPESTQSNQLSKKCNPEKYSSFVSKLTFSWFNPIIMKGYRKTLTSDDMWPLDRPNQSAFCVEKLNKHLLPTIEKHRIANRGTHTSADINFFLPILRTFWPSILFNAILILIASLLAFTTPIALDRLIRFTTQSSSEPKWKGYSYAFVMFVSALFGSLLKAQYEHRNSLLEMQIKSCIFSVLYKKCLILSSSGRKDYTIGEIVNLMSVDTEYVLKFISWSNNLWLSPLQIVISLYLLWQQLGPATLAGVLFMILIIPFNGFIGAKEYQLWAKLLEWKDRRVKMINEVLNSIKVLKLYAWETSFRDQIHRIRSEEVAILAKVILYSVWNAFFSNCSTFIVTLLSFVAFIFISSDNILDANKAFVSLSLFDIIRGPLVVLPMVITSAIRFLISIRRINAYLNAEEINFNSIERKYNYETPVLVEYASFKWDHNSSDSLLNNISLRVKRNTLVAVVGQVGSGKSSLLSALLGDMDKINGLVNISGNIAYVPQQAWIQNTTLRQNVLFMSQYNQKFYQNTLDSCALGPDLETLSAGDMTQIGEKGINLSGGQKQRVSLARAVYSDADIYLLDDPLSAVDAHVGRHLFDEVIGPKGMLRNKTRILVTHKASILPNVDQIVVIKNGSISEFGTFEELIARKGDFAEFLIEYVLQQESEVDIKDKEELKTMAKLKQQIKPLIERQESVSYLTTTESTVRRRRLSVSSVLKENEQKLDKTEDKNQTNCQTIEEETLETGSVSWNVYKFYFQLFDKRFIIIILFSYLILNVATIMSGLWLIEWSDDALDSNRAKDQRLRYIRLGVYAGIGLVEAFFTLMAQMFVSLSCVKAAELLHIKMLNRIIRAPMAYFDITPIGRTLNRFSQDMDIADGQILFNIRTTCLRFFSAIVSFGMICLGTPLLLLVLIPLAVIYSKFQRIYIQSSGQLNRIEAMTRSPIYSHFGETFNGTTSVRAYGAFKQFIIESHRKIDANNCCQYSISTASQWLAVRLEFLGYFLVFIVAISSIAFRQTLNPGMAGLAITFALNITVILSKLIRAMIGIETDLVSIERCIELTQTPEEAKWFDDRTKPVPEWPKRGVIRFDNYSTRYRDGLDSVLKNISFEVMAKEKVGIVGRTGAGKSSLALALFRLIEPTEGTIYIDDIDISRLGLYDLRSRLTVIPQDPVLFNGSLRMNLDPFGQYSDQQIWKAFESSHLKTFVESLENGLDFKISESGENLSVGQKQLVCLSRALLRRTRILVLDEATAAVDIETDDLIQKTIRKEFFESTIVTIVHRLETIVDYSRVVVMDKEVVVEFDSPKQLLANTNTIFYSMAKDANLVSKFK